MPIHEVRGYSKIRILSFRTSTISLAYLRQCLLFSRFPNINGKWKRQNIRICATNFLLTKNEINYYIVMKMSFGKINLTKYHGTADWIFPVLSKIQFVFAHNIIDENLIFSLRKTKYMYPQIPNTSCEMHSHESLTRRFFYCVVPSLRNLRMVVWTQ